MIVNVGLGDEGVHVCLDDQIVEYNPIRLVELCNEARKLFVQVYLDTLPALVTEDDEE